MLIRNFFLSVAAILLPVASYPHEPVQEANLARFRHGAPKHAPAQEGDGSETPAGRIIPAGVGFFFGLVASLPAFIWMHHRQQRRLREQQSLLGDELHDQLGPMIYYSRMLLASEIRQLPAAPAGMTELQNQLARTGETVRDLSKALRQDGATTLTALEGFLAMQLERWRQSGSGAGYVVHGTVPELTLSLRQYTQLHWVLQEFMLNSCRHASGKAIHLAFEAGRRQLRIRYWDEGRGFDPAMRAGTGTCSTLARIERINGTLKVDNRFPEGYEILITLPL